MIGQPNIVLDALGTPPVLRLRARDLHQLFLAVVVATLATAVAGVALVSAGGIDALGTRHTTSRLGLAALPIAARAPVSAALGAHEPGYRVLGLRARNPRQRLTTTFSRAGVSVASGSAHVRLRLVSYGHGSALREVEPAAPRATANRVDYVHRGIDEWYANGPLGLEQGFDVSTRPATGSGPLSLSLSLSSALRARLDRTGVALTGTGGSLRYGGLSASDARGRSLPTSLELRSGRIVIRVDDRGAVYPLRIDPFIQQAELTASDGATGDLLGASLAISGDTIVAGAPARKVGANAGQGAVYVFVKPASGWANATQAAELTASDGLTNDSFGSVSISGDTIVAGALDHKVGANQDQGAVYVFVKPASGWKDATQTAELTASDGAAQDTFGGAVGISGDTVVASSASEKVGANDQQGAAYVFVKPAAGWKDATQTARLTASDGAAHDFAGIGNGVAISGDTIVVGAGAHEIGANADQGAAYVFVEPVSGWTDATQTAELTASDGGPSDLLGSAVSISGDTVVVGAPFHQVGISRQGAAYVFVKPFFGWLLSPHATQAAELTASDGATDDRFGGQLGVSGDTVVASSFVHQVGATRGQGAAYVFTKPGNAWKNSTQSDELTASDGTAGDAFGDAVAISGSLAVAGSPLRTVGGNARQGAVYLFGLPPAITIGAPANGDTFAQRRAVPASYSCVAPAGATITACSGPVAAGAPIDTTTLGQHSFTVHAIDSDGLTATQTVAYTIVAPPTKTTLRPSITGLRQSASVWREGSKLAQLASSHQRQIGTTFSFALNEPVAVTLSFTKHAPGRKIHGRCVNQNARNRHARRCTRSIAAGALRLTGHAGANRVRFAGRLSRTKTLSPGTYTLRITGTDTSGQSTSTRALRFTIVK
jgi:FG-GAP repeat